MLLAVALKAFRKTSCYLIDAETKEKMLVLWTPSTHMAEP